MEGREIIQSEINSPYVLGSVPSKILYLREKDRYSGLFTRSDLQSTVLSLSWTEVLALVMSLVGLHIV